MAKIQSVNRSAEKLPENCLQPRIKIPMERRDFIAKYFKQPYSQDLPHTPDME
jgi:hypothetical protein